MGKETLISPFSEADFAAMRAKDKSMLDLLATSLVVASFIEQQLDRIQGETHKRQVTITDNKGMQLECDDTVLGIIKGVVLGALSELRSDYVFPQGQNGEKKPAEKVEKPLMAFAAKGMLDTFKDEVYSLAA